MLRMGCVLALALMSGSACAAEELLAGRVQKVIQQPRGADECPDPCPVVGEKLPDGQVRICISNAGGCEAMEFKVERDFLGRRQAGSLWTVSKRVGEWGPAFPVTSHLIVVYQNEGQLRWTPAMTRGSEVLVHPERFISVADRAKREWFGDDTTGMVPVEQVIERLRARR